MQEEPSSETKKETRLEIAIRLVYSYMKSEDAPPNFTQDDVFVIWYCKTLENWKAILSASYKGAPLIEVTYSGVNKDTCLDVYKKKDSLRFY